MLKILNGYTTRHGYPQQFGERKWLVVEMFRVHLDLQKIIIKLSRFGQIDASRGAREQSAVINGF